MRSDDVEKRLIPAERFWGVLLQMYEKEWFVFEVWTFKQTSYDSRFSRLSERPKTDGEQLGIEKLIELEEKSLYWKEGAWMNNDAVLS